MNLNEHFEKMVKASNDQLQEKLQEVGKELNRLRDIEKEKKQADRTIEKLSTRIVQLQTREEWTKERILKLWELCSLYSEDKTEHITVHDICQHLIGDINGYLLRKHQYDVAIEMDREYIKDLEQLCIDNGLYETISSIKEKHYR